MVSDNNKKNEFSITLLSSVGDVDLFIYQLLYRVLYPQGGEVSTFPFKHTYCE